MTARPRTGGTMIDVLVSLTVLSVSSASVIPLLLAVQRTTARITDLRHATALVHQVQEVAASAPCSPSTGFARQGRTEVTWSLAPDASHLRGEAIVALPATHSHATRLFTVPLLSSCAP